MEIYIVIKHDAKLDFKSKFIIYKQILNNVILTFKYKIKI